MYIIIINKNKQKKLEPMIFNIIKLKCIRCIIIKHQLRPYI